MNKTLLLGFDGAPSLGGTNDNAFDRTRRLLLYVASMTSELLQLNMELIIHGTGRHKPGEDEFGSARFVLGLNGYEMDPFLLGLFKNHQCFLITKSESDFSSWRQIVWRMDLMQEAAGIQEELYLQSDTYDQQQHWDFLSDNVFQLDTFRRDLDSESLRALKSVETKEYVYVSPGDNSDKMPLFKYFEIEPRDRKNYSTHKFFTANLDFIYDRGVWVVKKQNSDNAYNLHVIRNKIPSLRPHSIQSPRDVKPGLRSLAGSLQVNADFLKEFWQLDEAFRRVCTEITGFLESIEGLSSVKITELGHNRFKEGNFTAYIDLIFTEEASLPRCRIVLDSALYQSELWVLDAKLIYWPNSDSAACSHPLGCYVQNRLGSSKSKIWMTASPLLEKVDNLKLYEHIGKRCLTMLNNECKS